MAYDVGHSPFVLRLLFGVEAPTEVTRDLTYVSFHHPTDTDSRFDRKVRVTYRTANRTLVHLCTPLMTLVSKVLEWNSKGVEIALHPGGEERVARSLLVDRTYLDSHGGELLTAFDQCVAAETANRSQGLTDFARRRYAKLRLQLAKEEIVVVEVVTGANRTLASEGPAQTTPSP